jgi:hypothetical protein
MEFDEQPIANKIIILCIKGKVSMRKFEYKYKIDEEHKTVVALSSFAGRTVVGVAKCSPEDTFDVDAGKKLAAARCALKVAEKRMKRAEACHTIAVDLAEYWAEQRDKMAAYDSDSVNAYLLAVANLEAVKKAFD